MMQHKTAWIDDETDIELQEAWKRLAAKKGTASGWQYRGSELTEYGWVHHFLSKYLLDEAETEEDYRAARAIIPASEEWAPQAQT